MIKFISVSLLSIFIILFYTILLFLLQAITRSEDNALHFAKQGPTVFLFVGVNGVGKTTTIGKLAAKQKGLQSLEVLFHAADRNRTGTRFNSNRILSPARLPVPPLRLSGGRRIRTFEGGANRFTVCPLWPLGNPTKCLPDN